MKYCVFAVALLFVISPLFATTWYAAPEGAADGDCLTPETAGTLALAVSKAKSSGDVIQLAAGTYYSTNAPITLSVAEITLKGATDDPMQTIIRGPGTTKSMTGIVVTKKATIRDLTICNYYSTGKGGAAVAGANGSATQASNLTAVNCRIENNTMKSSGNNSRYNTASIVYGGTWTNCVFAGNRNNSGNGGAADSGTFYNCHFTNNIAKYYGGALHKGNSYNCSFYKNSTTESGCCAGAVYGGSHWNGTFVANSSIVGGAGAVAAADKGYFYDCVFKNNVATKGYDGGGALSRVSAYNCTFIGNSASNGNGCGGAGKGGTFTDCYFQNNKTGNSGQGGALYEATAIRCYFYGNSARGGSGTYNCTVSYSVYSNNVALTTYDGNGVAFTSGTVKNCLIIKNTSTRKNTGIMKGATVINCTIVGNTINTAAAGTATDGTYKNCIFSGNTHDIVGGTHSNSLYSTSSGSPTLYNCIKTSDVKFNAGKDTKYPYYALRADSPARDAGVDVGWNKDSTDLFGKKRLKGKEVDLGCYEYQTPGLTFIVQ